MKCEECNSLVEEYFDGELDDQTAQRVAKHLDNCGPCLAAHRKLEREQEMFLRYECEAEPSRTFWEGVEARTSAPVVTRPGNVVTRGWLGKAFTDLKNRRMSPLLASAMVLVAIVGTIAVMRYRNSAEPAAGPARDSTDQARGATPATVAAGGDDPLKDANDKQAERGNSEVPRPEVVQQGSSANQKAALIARDNKFVARNKKPSGAERVLKPEDLVREAEQKYVAAIAMLSRDANRSRSRIDADAAVRFEQTLAAVDRTISDTRRAVRRNPGDPLAAKYMLAAYSKKVDVLRAIISY